MCSDAFESATRYWVIGCPATVSGSHTLCTGYRVRSVSHTRYRKGAVVDSLPDSHSVNPRRIDFRTSSRRSRAVSALLRATVRPTVKAWCRFPDRSWPYHLVDWFGRPLTPAAGVTRTRVELPNCPAVLSLPAGAPVDRFVLYLHGGGFVVGGTHLHRQMTSRFASDLRAEVLAVTYRKLPSFPIAEAVADCVDGYRYALDRGIRPENITLMGDSAGGYLVFMTALELRRQGLPLPAAIVSMSPLTDWDLPAQTIASGPGSCALFPPITRAKVRAFATKAARGAGPVSPARCDLTGLPPTLIQASRTEMFYPDAELMAERLAAHGVRCDLQIWSDEVHVFQAAASITPEAAAAVAEIAAFIDRITAVRHQRSA